MIAMEETFYTPEEVAKQLKVSEYTIKVLIRRKQLGAYKVGGQWRITRTAIDKYLEEQSSQK